MSTGIVSRCYLDANQWRYLAAVVCLFVGWLVGWLVGLFVSRRVIVIGFPCSQLANDYEAIQIAGKVERNRGILNDFFLLS